MLYVVFAFSALTLLVGRQKERPACKNGVMSCWRGCLSEARCEWFAYGPAGAAATPSALVPSKSRIVLPLYGWLSQVVLAKTPLNECLLVCFVRSVTAMMTWCVSIWSRSSATFSRTSTSCGGLVLKLVHIRKTSWVDYTRVHATLQHERPEHHSTSYRHSRLTSVWFKIQPVFIYLFCRWLHCLHIVHWVTRKSSCLKKLLFQQLILQRFSWFIRYVTLLHMLWYKSKSFHITLMLDCLCWHETNECI